LDIDAKILLSARDLRDFGLDPTDTPPSVVLHDPDDDSLTPFWTRSDLDA
jgi:hypothetical protein